MSMKVGEQTDVSRLSEAKHARIAAGAAYDRAKKQLDDFNATVRTLVEDAAIVKRRAELIAMRDRLFHQLQEQIQIESFYRSAMREKNPNDWKRH